MTKRSYDSPRSDRFSMRMPVYLSDMVDRIRDRRTEKQYMPESATRIILEAVSFWIDSVNSLRNKKPINVPTEIRSKRRSFRIPITMSAALEAESLRRSWSTQVDTDGRHKACTIASLINEALHEWGVNKGHIDERSDFEEVGVKSIRPVSSNESSTIHRHRA